MSYSLRLSSTRHVTISLSSNVFTASHIERHALCSFISQSSPDWAVNAFSSSRSSRQNVFLFSRFQHPSTKSTITSMLSTLETTDGVVASVEIHKQLLTIYFLSFNQLYCFFTTSSGVLVCFLFV